MVVFVSRHEQGVNGAARLHVNAVSDPGPQAVLRSTQSLSYALRSGSMDEIRRFLILFP